jgi:hypothetical protein
LENATWPTLLEPGVRATVDLHELAEALAAVSRLVDLEDALLGRYPPRNGMTVLRGDPRNTDELCAALPGHDAVVSALGPLGFGADYPRRRLRAEHRGGHASDGRAKAPGGRRGRAPEPVNMNETACC